MTSRGRTARSRRKVPREPSQSVHLCFQWMVPPAAGLAGARWLAQRWWLDRMDGCESWRAVDMQRGRAMTLLELLPAVLLLL